MEVSSFGKKIVLFIIFFIVGVVMFGHFTGNQTLTSFGTEKVTMKFASAFLFLLAGLSLLIKKKWVAISIIVTCVYIISGWIINESKPLFLPVFEGLTAIQSLHGDIPSWMTLSAFVTFAIAELSGKSILYKIVGIQAIVALVGHTFNVPIMFMYLEGVNTGMAFNSAILFIHVVAYRLVRTEEGICMRKCCAAD